LLPHGAELAAPKFEEPAVTSRRGIRVLRIGLTYVAIIVGTLLVVDLTCQLFGLFPPTHNYGDPDLGWRPARATGQMAEGICYEMSTGERVSYVRNEDGVRVNLSRAHVRADTSALKVAVTGDSQTDLCASNSQVHSGFLQTELARLGTSAIVLPYGSGKYSPLQDYLAFRKVLRPYQPRVLVLNVYTGNDLYDMLRVDDRPYFVPAETGYRISGPAWFLLDDPKQHYRSRVLFAARSLAHKMGLRRIYFRLSELRQLAAQQGGGLISVLGYVRDVRRAREPSIGYHDAFTAQMLNQQLFFHRFPSGVGESIRRLRALLAMIRKENPGLTLVMSPLPSYQLVGAQPVDSALLRTLKRLPITYEEGLRQERALYEQLRQLALEQGWIFVDNLKALQAYRGDQRLYNNFDYHLLPPASKIIGSAQAAALLHRKPHATGVMHKAAGARVWR
jgi:hypothetical protein